MSMLGTRMLARIRRWRPVTWIVLGVIAVWLATTYGFLIAGPGPAIPGEILIFLGLLAVWFFGSVLGAAVLMLIWLWRRPEKPMD